MALKLRVATRGGAKARAAIQQSGTDMGSSSDSPTRPSRRSILRSATAVAGLGVGGGLFGASEAFACHLYKSPADGRTGCGPYRRDQDSGALPSTPTSTETSTPTPTRTSTPPPEPSPSPASGGRLRSASRPVLVRLAGHGLSGPHAGLQSGLDVTTSVAFIPQGQHAVSVNGRLHFDHSDAGIEAGAQQVAKMIISRNTRFGMFDVEHHNSVNVPASVGYNPSVDGQLAARYHPSSRLALRQEAVRYHTRLIGRVRQLLSARGGELGVYNVPAHISWYHAYNESAKSSTASKEAQDLVPLLPLLSFTGPQAQLMIDQRMSDEISSGKISDNNLIHWHAESVRVRRRALGGNARLMPTIWPRFFGLGGARLPNGSAALRPGLMGRLASAMLDAGAQGFVCWTPSIDRNLSSADQQAMSRSWGEVVDVMRSRGCQAIT
jgi:hypothetical protein